MVNKLYKQFLTESYGLEIIENEKAFLTYKIKEDSLEIWDIYSQSSIKLLRVWHKCREIAKENGCKYIVGFSDKRLKDTAAISDLMETCGFSKEKEGEEYIYYRKTL